MQKLISLTVFGLLFSLSVQTSAQVENRSLQGQVKNYFADGFDDAGLWILAGGSLLTVGAHQIDNSTKNSWGDHQVMSASVSKIGEFWGSGLPEIVIFGGQYYFDDSAKAIAGFEGLVAGTLSVEVIKSATARDRPDHSNQASMPSGHSQASFALATSMTESYGWKRALPFWGLAVLTAASRISDDKHWLSDVTAGATLGVFFGRAGFGPQSKIQPAVLFENGRAQGLGLAFRSAW